MQPLKIVSASLQSFDSFKGSVKKCCTTGHTLWTTSRNQLYKTFHKSRIPHKLKCQPLYITTGTIKILQCDWLSGTMPYLVDIIKIPTNKQIFLTNSTLNCIKFFNLQVTQHFLVIPFHFHYHKCQSNRQLP